MSEHTEKATVVAKSSGMVVGTDRKGKGKLTWRYVAMLVAAMAVALVAGGALRWVQSERRNTLMAKPTQVQKKTEEVQNMALSGNYGDAQKQVDEALSNPKLTPSERAQLLSVQAAAYENQKQYQKALNAFEQADKLLPTQNSAESIGRVYEAMGNKPAAINEYQLAVTRISKNNPMGDADKTRYQSLIANLGGQP